MRSHIRLLAVLEIVYGAAGLLAGLGALAFFGGIAALVGFTDPSDGKFIAIPVLGAIGTVAFLVLTVFSLPVLLAGIGLWREREWGRILSLILCAFNLLSFPVGTALGVYGLWVLLSAEGAAIFSRPNGHDGSLSRACRAEPLPHGRGSVPAGSRIQRCRLPAAAVGPDRVG